MLRILEPYFASNIFPLTRTAANLFRVKRLKTINAMPGSSKRSGDKTGAALGATKNTLQVFKEVASLVPADCVGPVVGAALKIIEMVEVSMFWSVFLLSSLMYMGDREREPIERIAKIFESDWGA